LFISGFFASRVGNSRQQILIGHIFRVQRFDPARYFAAFCGRLLSQLATGSSSAVFGCPPS
jgi:hypothetical protein